MNEHVDLLLIQQRTGNWENVLSQPSLPLSLITAAREVVGEYRIALIDLREKKIDALDPYLHSPTLIGLSIMTGPSILFAKQVVDYCREKNPDVRFLFGGTHPTMLPEETLRHPLADYILTGPGETSLRKILAARRDGSPLRGIPGLGYKEEGRCIIHESHRHDADELNAYALPAYDLVDVPRHLFDYNGDPSIYIQGSVGCNFRCSFCSNAALRSHWVPYSSEYIVNHFEFLRSRYDIHSFIFIDLDFFYDLERVQELCRLLIDRRLNVKWHAQGIRVRELTAMDDSFLSLLKASGFREFEAVGVETGSQRIADEMRKNISIAEMVDINRRVGRAQIPVRYNFLIGTPMEKRGDVQATSRLALRLNRENPLASNSLFYIYAPYPRTPFFEAAVASGWAPPNDFLAWGEFEGWDRSALHNSAKRRYLEKIHFLSLFTSIHYWEKYLHRHLFLKYVFMVYRYVAIARLETDTVWLMPEFWLWKVVRDRWMTRIRHAPDGGGLRRAWESARRLFGKQKDYRHD